jgi:hypothetical protein
VPKKSAPKRKAVKSTAPKASRPESSKSKSSQPKTSKPKASKSKSSKRKPSKGARSQDTTKEMATRAAITGVVLLGPAAPIQTAQFSQFQITVTLTGKKNSVPQCDIRASLDDGPPSESAGFGNAIKPLLQEVIHKLSLAYPGLATITQGVDGNGDLIPTGAG